MPMLGLHLATLAKLLQYIGGRPAEALRAAEEGQAILQTTHVGLVVDGGGGALSELQRVVSESSLEISSEAQRDRYEHFAQREQVQGDDELETALEKMMHN